MNVASALPLNAVASAMLLVLASSCGSAARRNTTVDEQRPRVSDAQTTTRARALRVGDRAPALDVDEWIRCRPIADLEEDKLYVVVFWATWNAPSVASLAHLSAIQREHAAVTIIAVAANEKRATDASDERAQHVREFLERQGSRVQCRVAFDAEGSTRAAWADEVGEDAVPRAFLVDRDNRIAWIGHPMQLEPALHEMLLEDR